jgi:hypothetical protein
LIEFFVVIGLIEADQISITNYLRGYH